MTQQELANRAGCTRQTIIALEQGKYVPSIELAFGIAKAFGVTLEEVFQYEESTQCTSIMITSPLPEGRRLESCPRYQQIEGKSNISSECSIKGA